MGLPKPAEENPEHGVGIGSRAHRRPRTAAHALLVDDDRSRQPLEHVDVRASHRRHESLHECAVGLVDHALGLRSDRVEHERALSRSGYPGEHCQTPLWEVDAHILQIVCAGT